MTHLLLASSGTEYLPLLTLNNSLIMSQLQDLILSTIYIIWLIDYESVPGPYIFHFLHHLTWLWISSRTVYFPLLHHMTYRLLRTVYFRRQYSFRWKTVYFLIRPYTFKFWGLYTFADRIVSVKRPHSFREKTVYFQLEDRILSFWWFGSVLSPL